MLMSRVDRPEVYLLGTVRDITDQKRAEEALKAKTASMERANEEVKQFAYIVSHDFRAPLVNLKGFAGEIRSSLSVVASALETALPRLDETQRNAAAAALQKDIPEDLDFIEAAASNMDSYVNALLKLSRLGRRELHPERVRVAEVVERSLNGLAHQIGERGVTVSVGPLPEVVADRIALEQIMGNILTNAVLYLEPAGRAGSKSAAAAAGTKRPSSSATTVAALRRRTCRKSSRRSAGRESRMSRAKAWAWRYVRTLVHRLGGEIRCESQPGVGTTFTFTIANSAEPGEHDVRTPTN